MSKAPNSLRGLGCITSRDQLIQPRYETSCKRPIKGMSPIQKTSTEKKYQYYDIKQITRY